MVKCKPPTAKAGKYAGFKKTLYQLMGNEPPEKYILWVKDVVLGKVVTNTSKPDWDLVWVSLVDLTNKAANHMV